ncbi:MAG: hypothetical protein ABH845_01530 [Candidatus Omnitrophota bacterium]
MKTSKRNSFTLLEVLIALSFFSVVIIVVGSVFGTGLRAWRQGDQEGDRYQQLRIALERMAVEIRNAPAYQEFPPDIKPTLFSFVSVQSNRFSEDSPDWVRITYEAEETDSESVILVRRVRSILSGEETEETLLASFARLGFLYPSFEGPEEWSWKEEWEWSGDKRLPPFFKLEFSLDGKKTQEKIFQVPTGIKGKEIFSSQKGEEG